MSLRRLGEGEDVTKAEMVVVGVPLTYSADEEGALDPRHDAAELLLDAEGHHGHRLDHVGRLCGREHAESRHGELHLEHVQLRRRPRRRTAPPSHMHLGVHQQKATWRRELQKSRPTMSRAEAWLVTWPASPIRRGARTWTCSCPPVFLVGASRTLQVEEGSAGL